MTEISKRFLSSLILLPVSFYLIYEGSLLFNIFLIIIFGFAVFEFIKFKLNFFFKIIGLIYILISFFSIFLFRNIQNENNFVFFLLVIITSISTDIGGFTFGKIFKGPKITKISPNKTYSGMFGAYIMSVVSLYLILEYFPNSIIYNLDLLLAIILLSTISQLGDLFISYLKRISNLKDTGKIIPGHGGILDRIDGMIFAFPFSYTIFIL